MMRPLDQSELQTLIDRVFDDVEAKLFYAIKTSPDERPTLLAQLDVINIAKERVNARIEYPDPTAV